MSEHEHEGETVEEEIAEQMGDDEDEQGTEEESDETSDEEAATEGQAAPDSEADMEAIGKKLDGLQKHVARRMGEILGDEAQHFEECEVCSFFNTPGWRFSGPYPPEVEVAVRTVLGMRAPDDYRPDGYSRQCDKCNGLGECVTGSKVLGQEALPCIDCAAKGWIAVGDERKQIAMFTPNGPQPTAVAPTPTFEPQPDPSEYDGLTVAEAKARGGMFIPPYVNA